ncbi:MAG: 3'(2'),5'-bisphosphate nucleotidase CysQ [Bacteroidia bacterium]
MQELLKTAITASIEAGASILTIYKLAAIDVTYKDDRTPLTLADRASHDVIVKALAGTDIPVLSEEDSRAHEFSERSSWSKCWIVDPLDGTKEFIKRNGEFTVNIALADNGKPILGVIYTPVTDVLHFAAEGIGSFRVDKASSISSPDDFFTEAKKLPAQKLPSTFTIVGSRSHASPETEAYVEEQRKKHGNVEFVAAGSSLKFCLIAEGIAHVYPRFAPTMEWDTAAGQVIVEQAGGEMIEWPSKNQIKYNREQLRNTWFLVTAAGA